MKQLRARDYSRVSHKDKERGISIDIQREANAECAAREGWRLGGHYCDDGISAYNDQIEARPQFAQMLQDARAKQFDVLIVYKWDRLARKQVIFYQVLAELERLGIQIHAATESNDWLARGVSGLMAEQYSRMLSARMKDVRRWEASQGRHIGPVPWGFVRKENALLPTELIRWPIRAFDLYASRRYGFGALADQLATEGAQLESGKVPTKFQIAEVLRNPVYIGKVRCNDSVFDGNHVPVIASDVWERVQELLGERGTGGNRHKVAVSPLLAGLARCADCGMPMWYSGNGKGYYQCSGRLTRATQCEMGGVRAPDVEEHLLDSLAVLTQNAEHLSMIVAELGDVVLRDRPAPVDTDAIQAKIKRIARLYADGLRSDDEYEREIAALRAQLNAAPPIIALPSTAEILTFVTDVPALLRQADSTDRRAVLHEIFQQIVLTPHMALTAKPRAAYSYVLTGLDQHATGTDWWAGWAYSHHTRTRIAA
jgi:site-specific DNA recombinase